MGFAVNSCCEIFFTIPSVLSNERQLRTVEGEQFMASKSTSPAILCSIHFSFYVITLLRPLLLHIQMF